MATPPPADRPSEAPREDPELTFAGNVPLNRRWWWPSTLRVVAGLAVIYFQVSAFTDGGGMWLNIVLMVLGAAVVVAGLIGLQRAWAQEQLRKS